MLKSRKAFCICFLCIGFFSACFLKENEKEYIDEKKAYSFDFEVIDVIDGDSFVIKPIQFDSSDTLRLRLADAPEYGQDYFLEAKSFGEKALLHQLVHIDSTSRDRYGRLLGRVVYKEQSDSSSITKDFSSELIRHGLAWYYNRYEYDDDLELLEKEARDNKLSLWSEPNQLEPWRYRSQNF